MFRMFRKELQLTDLVSLEEWQKIQDSLSDAIEITVTTISTDGKIVTPASNPNRFCIEILPKTHHINSFCSNCILKKKDKDYLSKISKETKFECPFGLNVFIAPISAVGNRIVAYMVLGPLILKSRKEKSEYAKEAKKLNLNLEDVMDALIEINVFSYNKIYAIIGLIKEIFSYVARAGYHKKRLGEIAPEVVELDPLFSRYYEEKILSSLLRSCTLALDADSGSVMTVDKKTNLLHIKAAAKLDDEIVNNTHLKVGEGIAGVAARTAQPILLPKDENKNGLSKKMKRKYIKSSMIVPFNKANTHDVYGVINLNIVRRDVDFSEKDIAIVKELVNLASIALIPLYQPRPDLTKS